ncbi:hypothetical protein AYM40_17140 [Paraburkholderia phytofirmans OLGA172]|uniref:DUF6602 domain-containing protein n=1 Tax=Paraburkholderia phytofirmans OLGA172 TaxID=1417228 RepID=A0A160FNJ0_9BURK|nr:DUF6602 domain-containing protein [Paraburkholderia phytofirmans]ANB73896.1 hypothetical protein AYM40_17140 [Paraburkholderia phytofirmans OLGA172]
MSNYFDFISQELLGKLRQVKVYIKKHNPTIGLLTEEILRDFLRKHLPKVVSVEQGFIIGNNNEMSRQCDIIIYDSQAYAPFYRINDVVVVPAESVLAVIEVKTSITKKIFHDAINYFFELRNFGSARTYLFIFNSLNIRKIGDFLNSYKHPGDYHEFDWDTFQWLPDEITGVNSSFHLKKDMVIDDRDMMGYTSIYYEGLDGDEISALENFFLSIYGVVENHIKTNYFRSENMKKREDYNKRKLHSILAIPLFHM